MPARALASGRRALVCQRSMLRPTLAIGLCLLAASPLLAARPAMAGTLLDRVVAVVNDEVILMSELEVAVRSSEPMQQRVQALGQGATQQQVDQIIREERAKTLDDLVKSSLVKKEAQRFQIEVSEGDVDRYLLNLAQVNGFKTLPELKKAVEESGEYGAWSDYKQDIRDQLIVYKTTQSLANFAVTDAQVREQYRKMTRGEASKVEVERFLFTPDEGDRPGPRRGVQQGPGDGEAPALGRGRRRGGHRAGPGRPDPQDHRPRRGRPGGRGRHLRRAAGRRGRAAGDRAGVFGAEDRPAHGLRRAELRAGQGQHPRAARGGGL
jgi:hypothetical protein